MTAFLTRPNRDIDHDEYDAVIPIRTAELRDGDFQCVVDESKWLALSPEERATRLTKFEAMLRDDRLISNMQCRDTHGQLVITMLGSGRMAGAPNFMKGDIHGELPKVAPPPLPVPPKPEVTAPPSAELVEPPPAAAPPADRPR